MLILALDTSSAAGSAAIVRDGALAIERAGDGSRMHGERLPLELMTILRDANLTLADVDTFAVVTGPGSFTGLRVGIASIQGLAVARRKLVIPVSAFEAIASVGHRTSDADPRPSTVDPRSSPLIGVWIDGHRGEVFASLYGPDGRAVIEPPTSLPPEETLEVWAAAVESDTLTQFRGNGAVRYMDIIRARLGERATISTGAPPLAAAAGLIAASDPGRAVAPHALVPLYVGRSYVEVARDRRQASKP